MDFTFWFLIFAILIPTANLIAGLIRTYYAIYTKKTYLGSVKYWSSWKERKYDVAQQVLEELGIDTLEDLEKLKETLKKKRGKKKRRALK